MKTTQNSHPDQDTPSNASTPKSIDTWVNLNQAQAEDKPEHIIPIFDRVVALSKERGKEPKYPCGIEKVDSVIWGFHPGQVCTVAARTSDGKSAFMLQAAWNLAKLKKKVLIISLEMSKEELVERLFCHEMLIDNQIIRRGNWESVQTQMSEFVKKLHEIPLFMVDKSGYSIDEAKKIIDIANPEVVFLDYLQLIRSGAHSKRHYEIGEFLREFRAKAKQKNFCLIVLAQIHRASQERTDKRPKLHDLKDSGDIEQDSDTVLLLYWNCNNEKESDMNRYEVIVGKQRYGEVKQKIEIRFKPENYLFSSY